jgi:CheY-like chemotaxis protein
MTEQCATPLTILVVDDDADTVESTAVVLSLYGFRVLTANTGEEALRAAATGSPDVVLADLMMPKLDGYELARLLRLGDGRPPVLVAVSGCVTEGDRRKTTAAGFDLHLAKPVEPAVLVGLLRRVHDSLAVPADPAKEFPA